MIAARVVVRGRVQGVGFRNFALHEASNRGIGGEVWNRRDGAVELMVQVEERQVFDELIDRLRAGPGRVDDIQIQSVPPDPALVGFVVGVDR